MQHHLTLVFFCLELVAPASATAACPEDVSKPLVVKRAESLKLRGTVIVNDKSKGTTWMLDLKTGASRGVVLPLRNGNHESAITADGKTVAVPHYETVTEAGQNEGGSTPGSSVSIFDIPSGQAHVIVAEPNPLGFPKPHSATFALDDQYLLVTAQVESAIVRYNMSSGVATAIPLAHTGCHCPHLVRVVPQSTLAVTGCRCTNPNDPPDCQSKVAYFDVVTGEAAALDAPKTSEGFTVAANGDVWVGGLNADTVAVYSFGNRAKRLGNLQQVARIHVPFPLRLWYDEINHAVGVVSLDLASTLDGSVAPNVINFRVFDASSYKLKAETSMSGCRGTINQQGLGGFSLDGAFYYISGSFDTQTVVLLDAVTLEVVLEVLMPRCTHPIGSSLFHTPTFLPNASVAKQRGFAGANLWSGGYCPATALDKLEHRFAVFDGFNWSPVPFQASAAGADALESRVLI